jgi:DNA (cytosine-5)-methyltransferase 1
MMRRIAADAIAPRLPRARSPHQLLAVDLFSGCGGLTLGLKKAGFKIIGAVDNDPLAVETYRANYPDVQIWQTDIRELSAREVMQSLSLRFGELDLLAGCPPCQAFSSIRTRNRPGKIRDKNTKDLVLQFLRFVRQLQPRAIMLENVPGMASDARMRHVYRTLKYLGYSAHHRILDASKYGVPQRRKRLILLASKQGPIPFAPPSSAVQTVREAIGSLPRPSKSRDRLHKTTEHRSKRIKRLIRGIPKNGGSRLALGLACQLPCHRRISRGVPSGPA